MTTIGEKFHNLLQRIRGGEEVAHEEVESVLRQAVEHFAPTLDKIKEDVTATFDEVVADARVEIETLVAKVRADVTSTTAGTVTKSAAEVGEPVSARETPTDASAESAAPEK